MGGIHDGSSKIFKFCFSWGRAGQVVGSVCKKRTQNTDGEIPRKPSGSKIEKISHYHQN
jgi:hypothetical protein